MEQLLSYNMVLTALLIFVLRVVDVTLGTIRTISMVNGRVLSSVILGFFEVLIWITVISGVMIAVNERLCPVFCWIDSAGTRIYGGDNENGLYDENGPDGVVDVGDASSESSIHMHSDLSWSSNSAPAPLDCLPFPDP